MHGAKGKEFDNVLLIINKGLQNNTYEYEKLFKFLTEDNQLDSIEYKLKGVANLLYVAITRAISNLYIVYNEERFLTYSNKEILSDLFK